MDVNVDCLDDCLRAMEDIARKVVSQHPEAKDITEDARNACVLLSRIAKEVVRRMREY